MYQEKDRDYVAHVARYGHPSKSGFKDIIRQWRAEEWQPDDLVALYKQAGAQYFMALANHHDNMDLWNSTHQPWNSTRAGPKKDLIGGWAKATRRCARMELVRGVAGRGQGRAIGGRPVRREAHARAGKGHMVGRP